MGISEGPIRGLSDVEAIEGVSLSDQYSWRSTLDILKRAANTWGNNTALQFLFESTLEQAPFELTYRELLGKVFQTANLFHRLGIRPGSVVAYILPNLPQTHYVIWGGEAAGIVASANQLLEAQQITEILKAVKARILVTLAEESELGLWDKIRPILPEVPSLETVLQVDLRQFTDPHSVTASPVEDQIGKITVLDFDREIEREPKDRLISGRLIAADDIASYFHTGGTTGMPKIAPHTHGNQVYMAWAMGCARNLVQAGEVSLCGLPLFHVNAVIVSGAASFAAGARLLLAGIHGFRSPLLRQNFWKIVERYKVNYFSAVPTIYAALLDIPLDGADVSSLRFGFCGTAPMPPEVFRRFQQVTGVKILEGYGLTEGTAVSVANPAGGERKIGSIGIRYPYQEVKAAIVGEDGKFLREAKVGEIGVVLIKGPNVFRGYLNERDNKNIWAGDGWFNTGDLGRIDEAGYFWLTGRAKDLIIRGGHNIDPQMIEDTLCRHPSVAVAAAVGQPDSYAGEVPAAYVVLREGTTATAEEVLVFVRQNIGERAAAPVRIEIMDKMPVTAVGKIFKPELRHRALEFALSEALCGAGIEAKVQATTDRVNGTVAQIALGDPARTAQAEELLGKFTVKYAFTNS